MTTTLKVRFDGQNLVPLEAVDLPLDHELQITVSAGLAAPEIPFPGSPAAILRAMSQMPRLSPGDTDALADAIHEGRAAARFEGVFDEPAK